MSQTTPISKWILPLLGAVCCLVPAVSGGVALVLGLAVALAVGNPYDDKTKKLTPKLLSLSVVGLGAGMNLLVVAQVGLHGLGYTMVGITGALLFGTLLGNALRVDANTSALVSVGTAICGGSAIAAVAPVLRAKPNEVTVALAVVFLLNSCALFLFPVIGHYLSLNESQFGLWSALAIHDTSSVVGANLQYGPHALEVGTTVKLARALWIVPVTFLAGLVFAKSDDPKGAKVQPKRPWFILGFLLLAALVTWIPSLQAPGHVIETVARRCLVLTLFLIGTNLNRAALKAVGLRPFAQGVLLWILVGSLSLFGIFEGWIHIGS